jgi:hypothetical protein
MMMKIQSKLGLIILLTSLLFFSGMLAEAGQQLDVEQANAKQEGFIPTEKISEDLSVSFPVDI